ncbi:MAG: thioredoxin domain-containing protein, partial [Candidatus Pacebacteria bacterium]|nr:thioredoxin domain-containing protein [Candidatus Paceibacterota bacterium]
MKKNQAKKITFAIALAVFLAFVFFPVLSSAQTATDMSGSGSARDLEIKYPTIPAGGTPKTTETKITEYVKYVFNFAIAITGIIALISLIIGGVRFLTSIGEPAKISEAKSQITSAAFGIILLLGSFILLNVINPKIIDFQEPTLPEIPAGQTLSAPPVLRQYTEDLMIRVKEFAKELSNVPDPIRSTAKSIGNLTAKCDCQNAEPVCVCEKKQNKQSNLEKLSPFGYDTPNTFLFFGEYKNGITVSGGIVLAATTQNPTVYKFGTEWCGPCKAMETPGGPVDQIKSAVGPANFQAVDAEKNPALASQFNISSYPTVIVTNPDGSIAYRREGYQEASGPINAFNESKQKYSQTTQPTTPSQPTTPTTPVTPAQPTQPTQPTQPEQPEEPADTSPSSAKDMYCQPKTCYSGEKFNPCP